MNKLSKGEEAAVKCLLREVEKSYKEVEKFRTKIEHLMDEQSVVEEKIKQQLEFVTGITGANKIDEAVEIIRTSYNTPEGKTVRNTTVKLKTSNDEEPKVYKNHEVLEAPNAEKENDEQIELPF